MITPSLRASESLTSFPSESLTKSRCPTIGRLSILSLLSPKESSLEKNLKITRKNLAYSDDVKTGTAASLVLRCLLGFPGVILSTSLFFGEEPDKSRRRRGPSTVVKEAVGVEAVGVDRRDASADEEG